MPHPGSLVTVPIPLELLRYSSLAKPSLKFEDIKISSADNFFEKGSFEKEQIAKIRPL
ncbi:hypothetical protein LN736_03475 [Clostridium sp. WLY-B-L2]|uniref:Uncharacterized protein n=1 Tax=Clostridium aromativorans TaxID=2836848 RepID=A0ABS8N291_9CLOT|nr:hypothetical protein [Clostridium aromativorans]MCC9293929.1 hypothetical protein [Clostridium aromativorans]